MVIGLTLRREGHVATLALRRIADIGTEVVLMVDGDWRRTWLYRADQRRDHEKAVVDTRGRV